MTNRRGFLRIIIAATILGPSRVLPKQSIDDFVGKLRVEVETGKQDGVQTPEVPELNDEQLLKVVGILGYSKSSAREYLSAIDSHLVKLTPDQFIEFLKSISPYERRKILTIQGDNTDLDERIIRGEWKDNIANGDPDNLKSNMEHLTGYYGEKVGAFLSVYRRDSRLIYPVEGFILTPNGKIKVDMEKITEKELELAQLFTGKKIADNTLELTKRDAYYFLTNIAAETAFSILDYESEYRDPITGLICKNEKGVNFAITTAVKRHFDKKVEREPENSRYRFPIGKSQYIANFEFADNPAMIINVDDGVDKRLLLK